MFTLDEIKLLSGLIDLGVKSAGLQLFQNGGGITLHSALAKLQVIADEATKPAPEPETKEPE